MRRPLWIRTQSSAGKTSERQDSAGDSRGHWYFLLPHFIHFCGVCDNCSINKPAPNVVTYTSQYIIYHESKGHLAPVMGSPLGGSQLGSLLGSGWSHLASAEMTWLISTLCLPLLEAGLACSHGSGSTPEKNQEHARPLEAKTPNQHTIPSASQRKPHSQPRAKGMETDRLCLWNGGAAKPCWHRLQGWVKKWTYLHISVILCSW